MAKRKIVTSSVHAKNDITGFRGNLQATAVRLFADPVQSPDEVKFQVDNVSEKFYNSPYYDKTAILGIPPRTRPELSMDLSEIVGVDAVNQIIASGKIVFHMVGDTGAAKRTGPLTEAKVADMMVADFKNPNKANRPSFFFHLGDVVYFFGEDAYYYDQFYEPFRLYPAPIFAIPGNHDGMIHDIGQETLTPFIKHFCSLSPIHSNEAGGAVRTTMTQPGVYFTLDAPFVSIIGLYSNVNDSAMGGVISSQNGHYPALSGDDQLKFLVSELQRLKIKKQKEPVAVVIAVHHPPFSADAQKGGSTGLSNDLDSCFKEAGLWPDAVVSGHSHLYQRFTRVHPENNVRDIPYLVSGSGGFAMTPIQTGVTVPASPGDHTLHNYIPAFGYLQLTANAHKLSISFNSTDPKYGVAADSISIDLKTGHIAVAPKGKSLI